jgi:hypothetical protein
MERMLARVPTGPDPPRGWQDEGLRVFAPKEMHRMRSSVSNENNPPRGREPEGDAGDGRAKDGDGEEGEEWNQAVDADDAPTSVLVGRSGGASR